MKIFLVRHGESTGDVEDRYGGWYDDFLTENGKQQLVKTASELTDKGVEMIYASPLIRARQAAEIIGQTIRVNLEFMDELRERNYGVLGGLTKSEAIQKYPEAVEQHKNPLNTDQGGESWNDFNARVITGFTSITKSGKKTVVIVSHGGPIKCILSHLGKPIPEKIGDGEIITLDL